MTRKCKVKYPLHYIVVHDDSLEIAEKWCGGSIKGIKLPRVEREIEFFCHLRQQEIRAKFYDVIVELAPRVFDVYPLGMFHEIFVDDDSNIF